MQGLFVDKDPQLAHDYFQKSLESVSYSELISQNKLKCVSPWSYNSMVSQKLPKHVIYSITIQGNRIMLTNLVSMFR